ncbi:MAG: LL-diaminopimelate aminotransferase, partial [Pirellula sp.]
CGNAKVVQAFADVKDNCDSGQFGAIQKSAITALDSPDIPKRINAKYRRRLQKLVTCLKACGFTCDVPGGSYFLYTKAPKGIPGGPQFANAEEASQYFITQHSMVTVPWDDAGSFLRFSVTYEAQDEAAEDAMMAEAQKRIGSLSLTF